MKKIFFILFLPSIVFAGGNFIYIPPDVKKEVQTTVFEIITSTSYLGETITISTVQANNIISDNIKVSTITFQDGSVLTSTSDIKAGINLEDIEKSTFNVLISKEVKVSTITFSDGTILISTSSLGGGGGDPSTWSQYPAVSNVNMSNYAIIEVSTINVNRVEQFSPFLIYDDIMPPCLHRASRNLFWHIVSTTPYSGNYCFKSGNISHLESTEFVFYFIAFTTGTFSFYYRTSCEGANYDMLEFYLDDERKLNDGGNKWWQRYEIIVSSGPHRISFRYRKDPTGDRYEDAVYVDLISFSGKAQVMYVSNNVLSRTGINTENNFVNKALNINGGVSIGFVNYDTNTSKDLIIEGNVGIGTPLPLEKLHIIGNSRFDGNRIYFGIPGSTETIINIQGLTQFKSIGCFFNDEGGMLKGFFTYPNSLSISFSSASLFAQTISVGKDEGLYSLYVATNNYIFYSMDNEIPPEFELYTNNPSSPPWRIHTSPIIEVYEIYYNRFVSATFIYSGKGSLRSAPIGDSQWTELRLKVEILPPGGNVSFYAAAFSEGANYDYGYFLIDGVEKARIQGVANYNFYSYSLSPGTHTLTFGYRKDPTGSRYADSVFFDSIRIDNVKKEYHNKINGNTLFNGEITTNSISFDKTYEVGISTPTKLRQIIIDNNFDVWISTGTENAWDWKKITQ